MFILMTYGWLQVLYIFFFAPYCFLGNIYFTRFLSLRHSSFYSFPLLDICTITWWLSANGLRRNNPHDKLVKAKNSNITTAGAIIQMWKPALCGEMNVGTGGCLEIIKTVLECRFTLTWFYLVSSKFTYEALFPSSAPFSPSFFIICSFLSFFTLNKTALSWIKMHKIIK